MKMKADAFRKLYAYHFAANRKLWHDYIMPLPMEQFTQDSDYSIGSVCNQVVHMLEVDKVWFSQLGSIENPIFRDVEDYDSKEKIRHDWDQVEAAMQAYLDALHDDMLGDPVPDEDTDKLHVWQVLMHALNHGTDHRAQTLRLLNSYGVDTKPQDYVFYRWGKF